MAEEHDFADPLAVARRDLGERSADVGDVASVTLREGPRGKKLARWMTIKNRHTGEVHHHALTIETGKKRQGSWELDDKRAITLSDDEVDEIGRLVDFVRRARGEAEPQTAVREELAGVAQALADAPAGDRAALLGELLAMLAGDREGLRQLARVAKHHPTGLAGVSAALEFGRLAAALDRLEGLVAAGAEPPAMRALLGEHPALLGGGPGERLATRIPGDDEHEDVIARRLADGRAELVYVGAAAGSALDGHQPGAALTALLGRALADMAALAGERPRAVILLGRDGDVAALRALGDALRGIDLRTWDEVLRTGQRVLDAAKATVQNHAP